MLSALLLAASVACAQAPALSPTAEARLDALLADLLGAGRARAFVRLVPLPPDVSPPEERPEPPAVLWERLNARVAEAPPVLPGFPAPRSLREEVVRELARQAAPEKRPGPASPGSALSVTLLVDEGVSEAELAAATDAVARALGLAAERGDSLRAARAPLAPTWEKSLRDPLLRAAAAAGGTAGTAVLLGLAFVALALRGRRPAPVPAAAPARPPAPQAAAPRPEPPPAAEPVLPPLGADAAAVCAHLLRDGPEAVAAWLLTHAAPAEAAAVYARLPGPVRQAAARRLADAADGPEPAPATPGELAGRLKRRVAGLERLEDIVLRQGEAARAEACAALRLAAPAAAARLSALPLFPDLALADPEDLRLLLSPFSSAGLAAALASEPEAVREAFLDALPGVAAGLVRERLAAQPVPSPEARGEVLARWSALARAGRVRRVGAAAR